MNTYIRLKSQDVLFTIFILGIRSTINESTFFVLRFYKNGLTKCCNIETVVFVSESKLAVIASIQKPTRHFNLFDVGTRVGFFKY